MLRSLIRLRSRRILVDIDTQKRFFLDGSIVRVRNYGPVLANIRRVVAWARLKNIHMISTVQIYMGSASYFKFCVASGEGDKKISYTLRRSRAIFPAADCTDLPRGILRRYEQVIFHKRCFDPFKEPRVDRILSETQADEFVLIGATTEASVKATALGLLVRGKNVTVLADALGSYNKSAAGLALRYMRAKGAKVTDTRSLLGTSCLRLVRACGRNYYL